jgi:hypothetical protein
MTYFSDAMPVTYMSDGPVLPGEDVRNAMAGNTAHALAGHMLRPGHGFEHEPVDRAERDAQHTAQDAASDTQDENQAPAYAFNHAQVASGIRQSLRYGVGA